jgi:Ca-activated chloride channel family protein
VTTLALDLFGIDWPANLRWETPWALGLLVVPIILLLVARRRRAAVLPMHRGEGRRLPRSLRQRLLWLPPTLRTLGLGLLILALARPQAGEGKSLKSTEAVAIQIVVDRSISMSWGMEMGGRSVSRLECVKKVLREFLLGDGRDLGGRESDLIGLVSFSGFATTVCPLVRDHRTLEQLVQTLQPASQRFEQGTAIGDGLALGAARLRTAEQDLKSRHTELAGEDFRIKSKVVILLTDGDNNRGQTSPEEAARMAAEWGVKVYTIGIGAGGYEEVPTPFGLQRQPSSVDEGLLRSIASATGGRYFRATDGEALRDIYREIDRLEKSDVKTVDYTDYRELFQGVALAGAAALALELVLSLTLLRRWP